VRDPEPGEIGARIDWSGWYLTWEEDVGQGPEHDDVVDVFSSSLKEHLHEGEAQRVRVGRDAFFAWLEAEPNVRVSPDVYVLDDPPEPPWPRMWETWRDGHAPPRLALEVVSDEWKKDYEEAPEKYSMLGAGELVVFDPEKARGVGSESRVPLQIYRREPDGSFVRTYKGSGPARVESVDAWVVSKPKGGVGLLRLCRDPLGADIVPTSEERANHEAQHAIREAQHAIREAQRADHEAQRAGHEAQRAERLAARLRSLGIEPDD
jgi:Uma2 family endonuclease